MAVDQESDDDWPTWAEVTISEVLEERDALRRELHDLRAASLAAAAMWEAAVRQVEGERDRARRTAVYLEQEHAELRRERMS